MTPSIHQGLKEIWRNEYAKLRSGNSYTQSSALEKIAEKYSVNTTTIYRAVFTLQKKKHKAMPSWSWKYQKLHPNFLLENYRTRHAKKQHARDNIAEILKHCFRRVDYKPQELPDLAKLVHEVADVMFRPNSLLTLSAKHEEKYGEPLIDEVPEYNTTKYHLHRS